MGRGRRLRKQGAFDRAAYMCEIVGRDPLRPVLRSAYGLGVSQYQIAYVTNAINELVAYPEADLPE